MTNPDYTFEQAALSRGFSAIAGVDEVGRGPLAGPVVAAAVILDPANIPAGLNDSKKLTAKKRDALYDAIMAAADVSLAQATVAEIDEHNILRASHIAMVRAIVGLARPAAYALIGGNRVPSGLAIANKGIAKVHRRSRSLA